MRRQNIKMFIELFANVNKNYFFEKYKFLSFKEENKNVCFKTWYFLKSTVSILAINLILHLLFRSDMLNMIVLVCNLLYLFIGMDAKDWRLFNRADFVTEMPEVRERFITVLLGNLILKLFIENNLLLLILLFLMYAHISLINFLLFVVSYSVIYATSLTVYFLLQHSAFKVKKLFSIINYIFSFIFFIFFVYVLVDVVLTIFITFANNLNNEIIFSNFFNLGADLVIAWSNFITGNIGAIGIVCAFYTVLIIGLTAKTLGYLENVSYRDKEQQKYIAKDFALVKFSKKTILKFSRRDDELDALITKEFSLFSYFYKYNFKDYFFVCVADRALAFLIALALILLKFEYHGTYLLLFIIVPILLLVEINSGVGIKLITNMSFITDYNALLVANTAGFDIKKLIKAKIRFYYGIKFLPYLLFFIIFNIMFSVFHMPLWLFVLGDMINFLIILIFPKLYLTNNLIYSRMNYKNYEKYLDESKILDVGVFEFYPLNVIFKVWTLLVMGGLACTTIFSEVVNINILTGLLIVFMLLSILIVYLIMNRVYNNITSFIERGDYSADFAKIFKG